MMDISRNSTLGPRQSTTKISERQERRLQIVNAHVYSKPLKLESLMDCTLQEQQTTITHTTINALKCVAASI